MLAHCAYNNRGIRSKNRRMNRSRDIVAYILSYKILNATCLWHATYILAALGIEALFSLREVIRLDVFP